MDNMQPETRWLLLLFVILTLLTACSGTPAPASPAAPTVSAPTATAAPPSTVQPIVARAVTPTLSSAPDAIAEAGPFSGAQIVAALRQGGYVIYFRHGSTEATPDDRLPVDLNDCSTQRALSAKGREQATAIGQAIERLGIPIGEVLASPFCRTRETAMLAFGRERDEPDVQNMETVKDEADRAARIATLRRLLSTPPAAGTNRVIVAHVSTLSAATGVTVSEGGAAIFRPAGNGNYTLVAFVTAEEWAGL